MSSNIEVVDDAYVNNQGELILVMSSGNEINAGLVARPKPTVEDVFIENDTVMLRFNDYTTREAFPTSELGFKDVKEVYLDGYDVYAEYLDGEVKLLGNVFLETNSEIFSTYMNRDDGYIYGIRYNGEIETIGDLEQYVGDRLSENITQITSNDLEEVILHTTDGGEYNIGKIYFKDYKKDDESLREITNVYVDSQTHVLKVVYSDGVVDDAGITKYININGQPIVLANAFINEIGHLNLEVLEVDSSGQFKMRSQPMYNPDGIVTYEDVFDTKLIDAGMVKGFDGQDGTVYESVHVMSDGMVTFNTTDGQQQHAGFLVDRSIVDARIDENGILILELSDGTEIQTSNVLGKDGMDGKTISSASIDEEGILWLHFEEEGIPSIPAGKVSYAFEVEISKNDAGELIFKLSNGEEFNAGELPGVHSKYITEMENRIDGVYVQYSDNVGVWERIGKLSYVPQTLSINGNKLRLGFSDGSSVQTAQDILGKDGDGILNVTMQGRDLVVQRTIDNKTSTKQDVFEDIKGSNIEEINYLNETHEIQFVLDNGEEHSVSLPTLKDGNGVANIYKEHLDLIFEMNDGSIYRIEDIAAEGIQFIGFENDTLSFRRTITGEIYTINAIQGIDGNSISNVELNTVNESLIFSFTEQDDIEVKLPRGNIHNRTVDDIVLEEDQLGHSLRISFTEEDKEDIIVPIPKPLDGDNIYDVYVDENDDLVFDVSSSPDLVVFPTVKGEDGNSIRNIRYDSNSKSIVFNMTKSNDLTVPLPEATDGVGIEGMEVIKNEIFFTLTDGQLVPVEIPYGDDGISVEEITHTDDIITFHLSDGRTYNVTTPKGVDGSSITDVRYENQQVNIYVDDVLSESIPFRTGNDGYSITDTYMDGQDLVIETDIPEGAGLKTLRHELLKGKDAIDGVSVSSIVVDENSALVITMDDVDNTTYTFDGLGRYITNVQLSENNELEFHYSDDTVDTTTSVRGRDGNGKGISDINISNGVLSIELSDATGVVETLEHDLTGITVDTVGINDTGELIVTYKDGTSKSLGMAEAERSRWLKSASVSSNDILSVVTTDGLTDSLQILGDVSGRDGIHVTDFTIDRLSGDFVVTFSDDSTQNLGSIKDFRTLSNWKVENIPYPANVVVIHNDRMFLSEAETSDEPPAAAWREIAFNDNFTEVLAPRIITPKNDYVGTKRVMLLGSSFNGFNTQRQERQFEIYDATGVTLVHTASRNADSYTLPLDIDLSENIEYTWRMRDISVTGFESGWSEYASFTVRDELEVPTIFAMGDTSDIALAPTFFMNDVISTLGNLVELEQTVWEIQETETNTVVFQEILTEGELTRLDVPYGILQTGVNYSIRATASTLTDTTPWSDSLVFNTDTLNEFYVALPFVYYTNGAADDVDVDKPHFTSTPIKKAGKIANSDYFEKYIEHISSDWEVIDVETGDTILPLYDSNNRTSINAFYEYRLNREYRIRVRHNTRNVGSSDWSPWLSFYVTSTIEKPVLSTNEDVDNFPADGILTYSEFVTYNSTVKQTELDVTDALTGEKLNNWKNDNLLELEHKLFIAPWMVNKTVNVRLRYKSDMTVSPWSDPIQLKFKENSMSEYSIYVDRAIPREITSDTKLKPTLINSDNIVKFSFSDAAYHYNMGYHIGNSVINLDNNTYLSLPGLHDSSIHIYYMKEKRIISKSVINDIFKYNTIMRNANAHIYTKAVTSNRNVYVYNPLIEPDVTNTASELIEFTIPELPNEEDITYRTITPETLTGLNGAIRFIDSDLNIYTEVPITDSSIRLFKHDVNGGQITYFDFELPESTRFRYQNLCQIVEMNSHIYVVLSTINKLMVYRINKLGVITHQTEYTYSELYGGNATIAESYGSHYFNSRSICRRFDNSIIGAILVDTEASSVSKGLILYSLNELLSNINSKTSVYNNNDDRVVINGQTTDYSYIDVMHEKLTYINSDKNIILSTFNNDYEFSDVVFDPVTLEWVGDNSIKYILNTASGYGNVIPSSLLYQPRIS